MKLVRMTGTAWAQIQACGVWLHFGGTVIGVFPRWWFNNRKMDSERTLSPWGLSVFPADHYAGLRTTIKVTTPWFHVQHKHAFAEVSPSERVGWRIWRRPRQRRSPHP